MNNPDFEKYKPIQKNIVDKFQEDYKTMTLDLLEQLDAYLFLFGAVALETLLNDIFEFRDIEKVKLGLTRRLKGDRMYKPEEVKNEARNSS